MIQEMKGELVIGTNVIALNLGVHHRNVRKLMQRHKIMTFDTGIIDDVVNNSSLKKRRGRKVQEAFLTEYDATRLILRMKNADKVAKFKDQMSFHFIRQRRVIEGLQAILRNNKLNAERAQLRQAGKIDRRVETDAIKEFIAYAKGQGSQNSSKYYVAISKMENSSLFFMDLIQIEHKNLRDIVSGIGLSALQMADRLVAKALKDGMQRRMYYKDIFALAKARVESFADGLGKITLDDQTNQTRIDYHEKTRFEE